jgi:hypothetical protein
MSEEYSKRRRTEFDDALKGYYQDHDEVRPEENPDYRSLTAESVGSLVLGFLSILTFVSAIFVIFPIMGIVLGVIAIRKILRASQELGGLGISSAGVALSFVLAIAGVSYQLYADYYGTPLGYTVITFADLATDPKTGRIPDSVLVLTPHIDEQGNENFGQPIFIEGYMFPTRQMTEITSFMLVPSVEQNKFGAATRNPTEMIDVSLRGDLKVPYRTSPVRVGGTLIVNQNPAPGETPYRIEADLLR